MAGIFVIGISANLNAQFGKKLKEAVQKKTENAIIEKTSNKAQKQTEKAMDGILNPDLSGNNKGIPGMSNETVDKSKLPSSYSFQYQYDLKMSTNQNDIQMTYLLSKQGNYMGAIMPQTNMEMVFDYQNNAMITIMSGMSTVLPLQTLNFGDEDTSINDYKITNLPNKTFLGYDCIGRQMENDDYKFIIYMATNLDVNISRMFQGQSANLPASTKELMEQYDNAMMMYMEMTDKKKKGKNATNGVIECVGFKEVNNNIKI